MDAEESWLILIICWSSWRKPEGSLEAGLRKLREINFLIPPSHFEASKKKNNNNNVSDLGCDIHVMFIEKLVSIVGYFFNHLNA